MPGIDFAPHNMTSDTVPAPYVVTEDTFYPPDYRGYRVFDGDSSTSWIALFGSGTLTLDLGVGNGKQASSWAIQISTTDPLDGAPKDFYFYGTNDLVNFDLVSSNPGTTWTTPGQIQTFPCNATQPYRYYQLRISIGSGNRYVRVGEIYLYSSTTPVSQNLNYSWKILANIIQALVYSWNILTSVSEVFSYSWKIFNFVTRSLLYSWMIKQWTVTPENAYTGLADGSTDVSTLGNVRFHFKPELRNKTFDGSPSQKDITELQVNEWIP